MAVTATGPNGEKIQFVDGRWTPVETATPPASSALSIPGQIGEGIASVAGNLGTMSAAGLAGTAAALNPFKDTPAAPFQPTPAADVVRDIQTAGQEAFGAESPGGQAVEKGVAKTVEGIGTAVKFPLAAVPLAISGKEEAGKFLDMPMGDYLGELAQDNGASPLFATLAHLSPDLVLAALGGAGAKAAARPGAFKPTIPTVDQLKTQAKALYEAVDNSGLRISNKAAQRGVLEIERMMRSKGIRKKLNPDTAAALDEIIADAKAGGITLSKAEELRQVINQAKGAVKPADAAAAQRLGDLWDDFIENKLKQSDIVGGAGDVKEVTQYLKSARGLWSRARKTDEIQELLRKAEVNVQSQQGNIGLSQAIRTQFRQIAANQKRLRRFTPEEQRFITRVATGDALERAARTLGKIAPTQTIPILGELATVGAAITSGNPALVAAAVALPVVGGLAKRLSSTRTAKFAQEAGEVIRRGP